jgi:hypothetical protein
MRNHRVDTQSDRQSSFGLKFLQRDELVRRRVLKRDDRRQPLRKKPVPEVPAHRRLVLFDGVAGPEVPHFGSQPGGVAVRVTVNDAAAARGAVAFPLDVRLLAGLPIPRLLPGARIHNRRVDTQQDHHRVLLGRLIEVLAIEPATFRYVAREVAGSRLHQDPFAPGDAGRDGTDLRHHVCDARDAAKRRLLIADDAGVFDVAVVVDEPRNDDTALRVEFPYLRCPGPDLARVPHHRDPSVLHQ